VKIAQKLEMQQYRQHGNDLDRRQKVRALQELRPRLPFDQRRLADGRRMGFGLNLSEQPLAHTAADLKIRRLADALHPIRRAVKIAARFQQQSFRVVSSGLDRCIGVHVRQKARHRLPRQWSSDSRKNPEAESARNGIDKLLVGIDGERPVTRAEIIEKSIRPDNPIVAL
jgi:hypothetical protein